MSKNSNKFNKLERRVLEIKALRGDAWVGTCLTAVNIIDRIFRKKKKDEKFILSSGHAGTALYVVLEKYGIMTPKQAEETISHPHLDPRHGIYCSTGSLGHGIGIALGYALATKKNVYCLISDGECAEGSVWESLMIMKKLKVKNLKVYVNVNGWAGYGRVNVRSLVERLTHYIPMSQICFTRATIFKGLKNHYQVLTKDEYAKRVC